MPTNGAISEANSLHVQTLAVNTNTFDTRQYIWLTIPDILILL